MNRWITTILATCAFAAPALAQNAVLRPRGGDQAVRAIVTRITTDAEALRRAVQSEPRAGETRRINTEDLTYSIGDLVESANHLTDHLDRRQVIQLDLDDIMRRGADLDNTIASRATTASVRNAWTRVRRDLDSLASTYGMTWDWSNPSYSSTNDRGIYDQLTGTYRLDPSRSDDPRRAVERVLGQQPSGARSRVVDRLETRLETPDEIALDRSGTTISIASSSAPRTTFQADGRAHAETGAGARAMTTRATLYGDRLEVVTTGNRDNDFTATFEPLDNGDSLRVTKQLTAAAARQPVVVRSVYRRISPGADWNVYDRAYDRAGVEGRTSTDDDYGIVPDGTTLVATLDEPLNLKTVRENDRVTLTVHNAPNRNLENAVIEGHVTSVPGVPADVNDVNDRARLSFVFNRIRTSDGRTSNFDGTIEQVRGPNGEPISFDGEDVSSGDKTQRDQAIQRGAIGAAVGALIGAVAGGAKGAAIGAVIGGGGAAATVLIPDLQSRDLARGTEFTIRAQSFARR